MTLQKASDKSRNPRFRRRWGRLLVAALAVLCLLPWLIWEALPSLAPALSRPIEWTPIPVAGVTTRCLDAYQPEPWRYCVSISEGSDNADVLYYLHGRRGTADWWNDREYYTGDVYRAWREAGISPPRVVSVSFGPLWLLTDTGDVPSKQRLRTFVRVVIPRVEAELGKVGRRFVVGESMGGVNALILAMAEVEHFDRVAALCPPLANISPYAGPWRVLGAAREAEASASKALLLSSLGRWAYPDEDAWEANDPLQRLRRGPPARVPRIYLSCGERDPWGCLPASLMLVDELEAAGHRVEWHRRPGGHCDVDVESLASFLAR